MAIKDFYSAAPSARQRVLISTVDTAQRKVDAILTDGTTVPVVTWEAGSNFRWPVEGERWTIYHEQGVWKLDKPIEGAIEALNPGDFHVNSPTGVLSVGGASKSGQVSVDQTTGAMKLAGDNGKTANLGLNQNITLAINAATTITANATTTITADSTGVTIVVGANTFFLDATGKITINGTSLDLTKAFTFKAQGTFTTSGGISDTWTHNLNTTLFYNVFVNPMPFSGTGAVTIQDYTAVDANTLRIDWSTNRPSALQTVHVYAIY